MFSLSISIPVFHLLLSIIICLLTRSENSFISVDFAVCSFILNFSSFCFLCLFIVINLFTHLNLILRLFAACNRACTSIRDASILGPSFGHREEDSDQLRSSGVMKNRFVFRSIKKIGFVSGKLSIASFIIFRCDSLTSSRQWPVFSVCFFSLHHLAINLVLSYYLVVSVA